MNEYGTFHQSPESHDTEYTPHDGVSMEHVRECLETACHEVQSLQAQQMEELMNLINKKALELAQVMHSEEMQRLRLTMRNRRVSYDVKEVARKKLQEHVNEARGLIMQTVSVKPEVSDSVQNVRDKVDSIIADKKDIDRNNADEVLEAVGIMVRAEDGGGEVSYRYPEEIMPTETTDKLGRYIVAVIEHQEAGKQFRAGEASRDDLMQKDLSRRLAHNAVARDFSRILQLNFPDGTPFREEDYRQIITEMLKTYRDGEVAKLLGLDRK